jgi:8-oxo-dGTP pyrophosphatase MutT (NUDIX family)
MTHQGSYIWRLRQKIGHDLVVSPAAVVAVVDPAGRILLHERTDIPFWGLPGGSVEPDGTFASAAVSELYEETGLTVTESQLEAFASLSHPHWTRFEFPNGDLVHSFNLCFVAREWAGEPIARGNESSDAWFFSPVALPQNTLPMSRKVIELLDAWLPTGRFQAL